ncbi:MAG: peptidylprolyl isomerase [Candidatus Omnitrophica bacterium]|nr:peptidylprolyl isomerase [Candidatus Omnitrophota bacterium]
MNKLLCVSVLAGIAFLGTGVVHAQNVVAPGMKVKFDYTLTVDKEEVETTKGKQPLEYVDGKNMLIPGLEKELTGMKVGEAKTVMVKPEDGYGPVRPEAVREFDKTKFPADITPQVGMVLEMQDPDGNPYPAMVKEVKDKVVMLDFNHPLAGKELKFDVTIVAVEPAPAVAVAPAAPQVPAVPEVKK